MTGPWEWLTIADVLIKQPNKKIVQQGWSPKCHDHPAPDGAWGVLKTTAIQPGRFEPEHNKELPSTLEPKPAIEVRTGDLLLTCAGPRSRCGVPTLVRSTPRHLMMSGKMYRFRPDERVDPRFLELWLLSPVAQKLIDEMKTGISDSGLNLTHGRFAALPIPVPDLDEQRRVVAILEDHLSRLDAADAATASATRRLSALRERSILDAITGAGTATRSPATLAPVGTHDGNLPDLPLGWEWSRLGEVAEVVGGITKDAKKQGDPAFVEVPYLRVANVQRGHLRLDNVTAIRVAPAKAAALALQPGDVLLNEGGDRDKLARGWVWEGQIEHCIHQNHVFRARIQEPRLDPYFLSWTANTFGGHWAERNGKQSVNLASISLTMIRKMPVIVPPAGVAPKIIGRLREQFASFDRLAAASEASRAQSVALRRALLAAAFSGRLTKSAGELSEVAEMMPA